MTPLFWTSLGVLFYGYLGFPILLVIAARMLKREVHKRPITPTVSVIIAAHNEGATIAAKLRNVLASDYPADDFEVVVASDGSDDDTVAVASTFPPSMVQVVALPRVGKAAALAEGVRRARGEVLVFTDANTVLDPDALRALAQNFADPQVGGVAGATGYIVPERGESSGRGEDLYWRYDTWLKTRETLTGSVVSAHGGLYAIRRELFDAPADPAVTDDFAISSAVVAAGHRLVFEPAALGLEHTMVRSGSEFSRRVRLMTRGLRGVLYRRRLLDPRRHGFYSVALFSHKLLRRMLPLFLLPLFVTSVALAPRAGFFAACALLQAIFYGLAALGWWLRASPAGRHPEFYVPFFYCLSNLAALAALWNLVRGRRIDRWTPQRHDSSTATELAAAAVAAESHAEVGRSVT